jgi:hypothetical protein
MPIFKGNVAVEALRGARVFLKLEIGITRARKPQQKGQLRQEPSALPSGSAPSMAGQSRQKLMKRAQKAAKPRVKPGTPDGTLPSAKGVRPENMIWIFGSGRSGSTWLKSMMGELQNQEVWEEPLVGKLFGEFYERSEKGQKRARNFIMGAAVRKGWIRSIRKFVIDGARYAYPRLGPDDYLVIKEPNGSVGAPLLAEALPESRLIFLVRDPRDVVASVLDGAKSGSWLYERKEQGDWKQAALADNNPDSFVKKRADVYLRDVGGAKKAYEIIQGPKVLVKYEDLREDPLGNMKRIYSTLGISVDEEELARAVHKHAWENVPEEKKGEGKFFRKASPGGWREDLTPEQVEIVEKVTAPLLSEFYLNRR